MRYIAILMPAFMAVKYEMKGKIDIYKFLFCYAKYCSVINFLVLISLVIIGKANGEFNYSDSIIFYAMYLFESIILALILPRVFNYCAENFHFQMKRENNEKK